MIGAPKVPLSKVFGLLSTKQQQAQPLASSLTQRKGSNLETFDNTFHTHSYSSHAALEFGWLKTGVLPGIF